MEADRIKWNSRYASSDSYLGEHPSPFLQREIDRIRRLVPGTNALDIACGEGRNSIFLAQHGFRVTALDIAENGLAKGAKRAESAGVAVDFRRVDLENYVFSESYDLIINFNFLLRPLIPATVAALNPGGVLLFDTIMASQELLQLHNPAYLLQPGELPRLFTGLDGEILLCEEENSGDIPISRIFFVKSK